MTEPLVTTTAYDTTESDSSEDSVKKPPSKGAGKKGVRQLIPTSSSKQKAGGESTPRPSGPAARVSDSHHSRLSRIGKHTFITKAVVEAVPTRTFVRPKKDPNKNAAVMREPPPSGSEGSESGGSLGRRRTIASSTLPASQRPSGAATPRGAFPAVGGGSGSRAATTSGTSSAIRPAPSSGTSSAIRPAPSFGSSSAIRPAQSSGTTSTTRPAAGSGTTSVIRTAASSAANVATSIAAHVTFNAAARGRAVEAKGKGAVPRQPRHTAESRL
ncbi:Protein of unknown function [Gryllus bimaculatus]|nr:Protein of unknown function [Gryllus bimaculatus]